MVDIALLISLYLSLYTLSVLNNFYNGFMLTDLLCRSGHLPHCWGSSLLHLRWHHAHLHGHLHLHTGGGVQHLYGDTLHHCGQERRARPTRSFICSLCDCLPAHCQHHHQQEWKSSGESHRKIDEEII